MHAKGRCTKYGGRWYYRRNHHSTTKIHKTNSKNPMSQHQFPPCRLAILLIRRNVPPRKVDVEEKVSFCVTSEHRSATLLCSHSGQGGHTIPDKNLLLSATSVPMPFDIYTNSKASATSLFTPCRHNAEDECSVGSAHILQYLNLPQ